MNEDFPDRWSSEQRELFLRLFRVGLENQKHMTHPSAPPIEPEHWETLCWNFAWLATEFPQNDVTIRNEDGQVVIDSSESTRFN